eukprot:evm.model.scf_375EXC.6 EVM.evm.TU.scf_375EXC.6   scf_375EXC:69785-71834(-)
MLARSLARLAGAGARGWRRCRATNAWDQCPTSGQIQSAWMERPATCTGLLVPDGNLAVKGPSAPFSTQASRDEEDKINDLFAEAREEIEDARDEADTVYYEESLQAARTSVEEVLSRWNKLLSEKGEQERARLQRSMGLKIEQLKAELDQVEKIHST